VGDGTLQGVRVHTDKLRLNTDKDVKELCAKFAAKGSISISALMLNARVPMPHLTAKTYKMGRADPSKAMKASDRFFGHRHQDIKIRLFMN